MRVSLRLLFVVSTILMLGCNDTTYMQGKRLYAANCQNCHMEDGSGLAALIPPLNTSRLLGSPAVSCVIHKGIQDTIFKDTTYLVKAMPAFKKFSATEITNIVNYINSTWHKPFKEITILQIEEALKSCP